MLYRAAILDRIGGSLVVDEVELQALAPGDVPSNRVASQDG